MPFIFDATMKDMVGMQTSDYAAYFDMPSNRPSSLLNVDLSTISAATDVVIGLGTPVEEITDLNFQAGPDPNVANRLLLYNSLLRFHYDIPVRSILVLLHPKADHTSLTGLISYKSGKSRLEFEYEVVRVWKQSAERYLNAGLGITPLAVLGALPDNVQEIDALREVVEKIEARLLAETTPENAARLLKAAYNLTILRVPRQNRGDIFRGVGIMKTGYDELVEEGVKQTQKILLRLGRRQIGVPTTEVEASIKSINDLDRLERMTEAVLNAKDWQELLQTQ
jgi:hypothetical protein